MIFDTFMTNLFHNLHSHLLFETLLPKFPLTGMCAYNKTMSTKQLWRPDGSRCTMLKRLDPMGDLHIFPALSMRHEVFCSLFHRPAGSRAATSARWCAPRRARSRSTSRTSASSPSRRGPAPATLQGKENYRVGGAPRG